MVAACSRLLELGPALNAPGEPAQEVAEMVLWNLTVLGEAAKRMPAGLCARHADVEWQAIARTRDVVVHHYEGIDWEVIRGIVDDYVPGLLARLIAIRDEPRS